MYEATISYNEDWRPVYRIEANTVEMLREKCKPWIDAPNTREIYVYKKEGVGFFKAEVDIELL